MTPSFTIHQAEQSDAWDAFLASQPFRPFLQSWTMGEVYGSVGQKPLRLEIRKDGRIVGICFGHIVPARRGRHISVPYGPVFSHDLTPEDFREILPLFGKALKDACKEHLCSFVRMSPFLSPTDGNALVAGLSDGGTKVSRSPLHLLAEHVWYLPLVRPDPWTEGRTLERQPRSKDEIFAELRKTTRNLIRRAEKDGVTIEASTDPMRDLKHFITLHDETRKRHGFTPYTDAFFLAQVQHFAKSGSCTLYLAHYQGNVIASAIHMHMFGETSYHHGASADAWKKIPASYLLQWRAIEDALARGDAIYNFWGIAPTSTDAEGNLRAEKGHPFAGVTLFKTGFGGNCLNLTHCIDLPMSPAYHVTKAFEILRKWKRGF